MDPRGTTVTPGSVAPTRNCVGPSSVIAAISRWSASAPASTGPLVPESTKPPSRALRPRQARVHRERRTGVDGPPRRDALTRQQAREHGGPELLGAAAGHGTRHHVGGDQRTRSHEPAHLLGHEREVAQPCAAHAASAVVLGDEHRRPTQLGPLAPPVAVEARHRLGEGSHGGERALRLEEPSRGGPEELLVLAQLELHDAPRPVRPSRGYPEPDMSVRFGDGSTRPSPARAPGRRPTPARR